MVLRFDPDQIRTKEGLQAAIAQVEALTARGERPRCFPPLKELRRRLRELEKGEEG